MQTAEAPKENSLVPYILFGMFVLEVFFLFVKKIDGALYGIFDLMEKLYPIIAIGLLIAVMKLEMNFHWWVALASYTCYVLYGILISLASQKGVKVLLVQTYHELKFFPVIFMFAMVKCNEIWAHRTLKILKFLIIASIFLIIFQYGVSGAYDAVFKNGGHFEPGHIGGKLLPRAVGWFWHPGQIALFFIISSVFLLVLNKRMRVNHARKLLFISFFFVFIAIQRLELAILFLVYICFLARRYIGIDYRPYLSLLVFFMFTYFIIWILSDQRLFWVLLEDFESPRTVFLVEALFELVGSNYIGAGWGTIGSHAAADVVGVYDYNNMKDLWWIQAGQYFYDTYWPHVIGETGLPGYFFLLFSMVFMIRALKRPEASLVLFVLVLTSALSSNAQSLYHLTVFGWFIMVIENIPEKPLPRTHAI